LLLHKKVLLLQSFSKRPEQLFTKVCLVLTKVVAEPIVLFTVDVDIESPIYSKKECKTKIKKAYKQMIFQNERKVEIEKG
jgi:hypothetical protein